MRTTWISQKITSAEQALLWDIIYVALWDAPDEERRPRSVLEKPAVKRLGENWGRDADFGLLAIEEGSGAKAGGIWIRLDGYDQLEGYGCDYPVLGIGIFDHFQNRGAGTFLLDRFIAALRPHVPGLRLGVNPRNERAIHLYQKFGFKQYATGGGGYPQMKLDF